MRIWRLKKKGAALKWESGMGIIAMMLANFVATLNIWNPYSPHTYEYQH